MILDDFGWLTCFQMLRTDTSMVFFIHAIFSYMGIAFVFLFFLLQVL